MNKIKALFLVLLCIPAFAQTGEEYKIGPNGSFDAGYSKRTAPFRVSDSQPVLANEGDWWWAPTAQALSVYHAGQWTSFGSASGGLNPTGQAGVVYATGVGNGTRKAAFGDVVSLFGSGSCTGFLKNDGSCSNGTASVTPAGINGQLQTNSSGTALGAYSLSGVLKTSTGIPAQATYTDIVALFNQNGTCTAYLKADGSCANPTTSAVAAGSNGQVQVNSGGVLGALTQTGLLKFSSGIPTAAAFGDIVALFGSGSCSGYLKNDGTCGTPAGGTGTPAGSNGQLQINSSGAFGGSPLSAAVTKLTVGVPSAAAFTDVVGLFGSGSCVGYLKNDGTCSTTTGGTSLAVQSSVGTSLGSFSTFRFGTNFSLVDLGSGSLNVLLGPGVVDTTTVQNVQNKAFSSSTIDSPDLLGTPLVWEYTCGTGGCPVNTLVKLVNDGTTKISGTNGIVVPMTTSDTGKPAGVVYGTTASAGAVVKVAKEGQVQVLSDGVVTPLHMIEASTTTAGYGKDSGTAGSSTISNTQGILGIALTATTGAGQLFYVDLNRGFGTQVTAGTGDMSSTLAAGAPSGACSAGKSYYLDTTNQDFYGCSATNTWKKILATSNSGSALITGSTSSSVPSAPGTGAFGLFADTSGILKTILGTSQTIVSNAVAPQSSATANNWVQYISNDGVQHLAQPSSANLSDGTTIAKFNTAGTSGNCVTWTTGNKIADAGAPCGGSTGATTNQNIRQITFGFSNGTSALSAGDTQCVAVTYSGTITSSTIIADTAGSGTVDVTAIGGASYTGNTSGSSITASAKPALSSQVYVNDSTLTGWTKSVSGTPTAPQIFCGVLSSPSTAHKISVTLSVAAN